MGILSVGLIGLGTMGLLFLIASLGSRAGARRALAPRWPLIYGLSLGVYFTSWTFYGAVGSAGRAGWDYLPIYLGPLLAFTIGIPILRRLVAIGRRHQSASIADFLAHRYGKSTLIGALVAVLAIAASLPYIALQINSIRDSMGHLAGVDLEDGATSAGLIIVLVLSAFAVLFGTRSADNMVRHAGLVLAIAAETLLKLIALVLLAGVAYLALGFETIWQAATAPESPFMQRFDGFRFITLTLLAFAAILCLPRQFHMTVVEARSDDDITSGRPVMIAALLITALVVPPIAIAGQLLTDTGISPDLYVLAVPMAAGFDLVGVLAFIGGIAASTGMVIVASLALSIMVSNDLINALQLRLFGKERMRIRSAREQIMLRRSVIMTLLLGAWLFAEGVQSGDTLAGLGLLAFAGMAQLMPALVGGLYWPQANKAGALAGIVSGSLLWLVLLALPVYGVTLIPLEAIGQAWFGGVDTFALGALICLSVNIVAFVAASAFVDDRLVDRMQATYFVIGERPRGFESAGRSDIASVRIADLKALVEHAIGEVAAASAFKSYEEEVHTRLDDRDQPDDRLLAFIEARLARVLGAASARVVLSAMRSAGKKALSDLTLLLGEAHKRNRFSHSLLESTLDNMTQGVSVVDKEMRVVAWNSAYLELFAYPDGMVELGRPVADLIRYNVDRGLVETLPSEKYVERRIAHYRSGLQHRFERRWHDGRTIEIEGNPLPDGGYVTTFTDITSAKATEEKLTTIASSLERRVEDRTRALQAANAALVEAQTAAEQATRLKTRFLAAASHDLMQPLNAARLYASALSERCNGSSDASNASLADKIDLAISNADQLIRALLNISKLDAGAIEPDIDTVPLQSLFDDLTHEFEIQAEEKGLALTIMPSSLCVKSDRGLLFSVLQNLVANAIRYTHEGRILVGAKRRSDGVDIAVIDTGPGIKESDQKTIFDEFTRLNATPSRDLQHGPAKGGEQAQGLGLGLSVSQRIAKLLSTHITVASKYGHGARFSIRVPCGSAYSMAVDDRIAQSLHDFSTLTVLCVDDDPAILDAEHVLLDTWGCRIICASNLDQVKALSARGQLKTVDLLLLDHQLGDGETGRDVADLIAVETGTQIPTIYITADQRFEAPKGSLLLRKPIEPASLRAAMEAQIAADADATTAQAAQ